MISFYFSSTENLTTTTVDNHLKKRQKDTWTLTDSVQFNYLRDTVSPFISETSFILDGYKFYTIEIERVFKLLPQIVMLKLSKMKLITFATEPSPLKTLF